MTIYEKEVKDIAKVTAGNVVRGNWAVMQSESSRELPDMPDIKK